MNKKIIPIKYTSRNFESIKNDLTEHARRYYPQSYKDFNEGSFGSLMIDTVSYVGDILSFYLDYQANESFLDTAIDYDNIVKIAKQLGYKHIPGTSTSCVASFFIAVPASEVNTKGPDMNYAPILRKGSIFSTGNKTSFILTEDVNFKNVSAGNIISLRTDGQNTSYFGLRAFGTVTSGIIKTETIAVGPYSKFLKVPLAERGIVEILSVLDSEGNEYFEVDHLSQNVIYKSVTNTDKESSLQSREILKPFIVPRRFVLDSDLNGLFLQFGASSDVNKKTNSYLTDPSTAILDVFGKDYISSDSFDPSVILSTDKLGISPSNTNLIITYRYNPINIQLNFASNALTDVINPIFIFENDQLLNKYKKADVMTSLEITNEFPIKGDSVSNTVDELKIRIKNNFSAQNRAVTANDYKALCYNMPSKYGAIKRVNVYRDDKSLKRNLNIYILSQNDQGHLTSTNAILKENLKTWLLKNKMINDTIDILDGKIVNFGIEFKAVGSKEKSKYDILAAAIEQIKMDFSFKMDFGEPVIKTNIYNSLKKVDGIVDVISVDIVQKLAIGIYSSTTFNFEANMSSDDRYLKVPENVIMELRYPDSDIKGTII